MNVLRSIRSVADSSRNANEGEDKDEQDDEMSEPTQLTMTEKAERDSLESFETAKKLRAITCYRFVTHEFIKTLSLKRKNSSNDLRNRPELSKKGVGTLQDV